MDIVLERILSLIPRKESGEFVHGSLKKFAESIGLKSGNLVSDWINGRSKSYQSYLYEIAAKYNVSVEWLEGKTDKKSPTPQGETSLQMTRYQQLNEENRRIIDQMIEKLVKSQFDD